MRKFPFENQRGSVSQAMRAIVSSMSTSSGGE